tara:strand:- start:492 stop:1253 length:762 start_codon:yes stop_codon:yes gene_type:complete
MNETLNFNFWVPISKSKSSKDGTARIIEGIASTPDIDLQNERVNQNGINFDYFLEHGYFNWDHKPGAENKIGEPWEVKVTPRGLYVKGIIYKGKKAADAVWEHIKALGSTPESNRKVGFSLQGKTVRRNGNSILKCWIQDIAITTAPINYNTYLDIVKAFDQYSWEGPEVNKAVAAGYATSNQTGGAALRTEDLDKSPKDLLYKENLKKDEEDKKYTQKSLANLIQRQLGYSSGTSEKLSDVIFRLSVARRTA